MACVLLQQDGYALILLVADIAADTDDEEEDEDEGHQEPISAAVVTMNIRTASWPDHSTFSRNRHGRFRASNILRHLFESVVDRCLREGLVGGEGFAVDASLIAADANKHRSLSSDEWKAVEVGPDAGRAAREYLDTLDDAAFGAASETTPKYISPSDPAAQWTGAHKGHAFLPTPQTI